MNDYLSKPVVEYEMESILLQWLPSAKVMMQEKPAATTSMLAAPVHSDTPTEAAIDQDVLNRLRFAAGDRFADILALFMRNTEKLLHEMVDALAKKDIAAINRIAHTLKATTGQIGALALSKTLLRIEETTHDGTDHAELRTLVTTAAAQFDTIKTNIT